MTNTMKKIAATIVVIILTITMFITPAFAAPKSKTSVKIHGTSSLGNKGDVIVITVPSENGTKKTYRGTLKGDHLDIDMGTTDNYFNVTESGIVVSFENETTDETGTFLLLGKEGNGTHKPNNKDPESDNGMNNFDAANIVFDNANEDDMNNDQNKDDQQNDDLNKDDQKKDDQPVNNNSQNTTEKKENAKPSLVIRKKGRNTVTISDEEVPLANVPKTGDNTVMIMMVMLTAVIGMIAVAACKTRKATNI